LLQEEDGCNQQIDKDIAATRYKAVIQERSKK